VLRRLQEATADARDHGMHKLKLDKGDQGLMIQLSTLLDLNTLILMQRASKHKTHPYAFTSTGGLSFSDLSLVSDLGHGVGGAGGAQPLPSENEPHDY
jgi:hypothetical protein